jgi:hypothetical protein
VGGGEGVVAGMLALVQFWVWSMGQGLGLFWCMCSGPLPSPKSVYTHISTPRRDTTRFKRSFSGRNLGGMLSHVLRPMTTAWGVEEDSASPMVTVRQLNDTTTWPHNAPR